MPTSSRDILAFLHKGVAAAAPKAAEQFRDDVDKQILRELAALPQEVRDDHGLTLDKAILDERLRRENPGQLDRIEAKLDMLLRRSDPTAIRVYATMPDMRRNDQPERPEPERLTIKWLHQELPVFPSFLELNRELLRKLLS